MKMSLFKYSLVRLLCLFVIVGVVAARPGKARHDSARHDSARHDSARHGSARHSQDYRLIGGEAVVGTNFSFLASLRVMPKELHRCGGFLVSHTHVMTTASCIYSTGTKELHAYMNPLRFDNLGTYIKVKEVTSHPNFTLTPHENDVAILKLVKSFEVDYPIIPDWVDVPSKSSVLTFGWGYDRIPGGVGNFTLHMFKLQVMANGLCSLVLREYLGCDTLCATSPTQFATSPADVGTPLIFTDGVKMFAVGMLVRETDDLVNAAPYMKLRQFLDWKDTVINGPVTTEPPTTTTVGSTTTEEITTTTTPETPSPPTTTPNPEDEYGEAAGEDYQEQPIKGRSRKRGGYHRQMFRDASLMGKRQISRFG